MEQEFISVKEAAKYLGLCETYVRVLVRTGDLEACRPMPRARIRFTKAQLDKYINKNSV